MDIPAPGLDIGLQIGDAIDDGHGSSRLRFWIPLPCLAAQPRSAQHSPMLYSGPRRRYGLCDAQGDANNAQGLSGVGDDL